MAYILSLVVTVGFSVWGVLYSGGGFGLFFVPVPLITLVLFPLIFPGVLYGKFIKRAFGVISAKNCPKEYLQKAYGFFKNYGQVIWITAITLFAAEIVVCVKYMEDKSGLGPMLQCILDTIIYAGLLHLLIVLPYKIIIKNRIIGPVSEWKNFGFL
jgi:hypothetical protein